MAPDSIIVAIISTVGGIIIAYITSVLAKRVQVTRARKDPKDRMERMFDGYERLIHQKDLEDERKTKTIQTLEEQVENLDEELLKTKQLLSITKTDLKVSKEENIDLRKNLKQLRIAYGQHKRSQATAK